MIKDTTIRISMEAYKELVYRKLEKGIPILRQVDDLVLTNKKGAKNAKSQSIRVSLR